MSNAGLDNWKRDYPVKERAVEILRRLVAVEPHPVMTEDEDGGYHLPDGFWEAHAEARLLISEVDANDP